MARGGTIEPTGLPMTERGDMYRLRARNMFAHAEQSDAFRAEFENLAMAFLRLAVQADSNSQVKQDRPAAQK